MKIPYLVLIFCLIQSFTVNANYSLNSSYTDPAHSYYTALLKYSGDQPYYINQTNKVIQNLNFTYFFSTAGHLIVKLTDANAQRWEVPYSPPFPHVDVSKKFAPYDQANLVVAVVENPFSFKVTRKSTSEVIFDSSLGDLIYSDLYLQLSTSLSTPNIFGLGDRATKFNLAPDATYTIFNKENPAAMDDGTPGNNLYGYHPVYLLREKSNSFNMVLLRSSSPMDVQFEGGKKLTYKVVGGVIDLNFFAGNDPSNNTPETVVKQYHTYLGGWTLQPFWSFGMHQCRYGYHNISYLLDVLNGYQSNNIPLDVIWTDIDYMDSYIDFTIDHTRFPPDQMRSMLQKYNKRWVPIIDAGIGLNNEIFDIGNKNNIYIKDPNGTNTMGVVWPGNCNFPDFFNPNATMFWEIGLQRLHELVPFSGIWTDMNEISNAVPGEVGWKPDPTDLLNNPPYVPNSPGESIYDRTLRMDALHKGNLIELYVHAMFGFFETRATFNFLKTLTDLVFILSRSTFYGSGKYAAHWTGDNVATYDFLAVSISHTMDFGLFGIPMTGADICGFNGNTTPELCARWFQLGALYPFARDHNMLGSIPQEPYALGPTVLETSRVSLNFRYSIVRHYYTEFLKQAGTGTIFRPVFFEFPTDPNLYNTTLKYTEYQFLIGQSLLVTPALTQGQQNVSAYFPQDTWFDFITGALIASASQPASVVNYPAPLNATAPIFIRGGFIVPSQNVTGVSRTDDLNNQYTLNIALKSGSTSGQYTAKGQLVGISNFGDDNVLVKCKLANCLYDVNAQVTVTQGNYQVNIAFTAQQKSLNFETVAIAGLVLMGEWSSELITVIHETFDLVNNFDTNVVVNEAAGSVVRYTFDKPFNVIDGSNISINIPKISI